MDLEFEDLYEKLNRIARGTFSEVYKCRRRNDGAIFALKEIIIENEQTL